MRHTVADLRGALRALVRTPGFAVTAILSLAIGIGANTAIFSVASALLLRPLPYQDADRLVILWNRSPGLGIAEDWFSTAQYFDIKRAHGGFETVAIAIGAQLQPDRRRRAGADRHDPRLVEPAADARRARRCSAGCSRRTTIGRAAPARRCSRTARGCGATAATGRSSAASLTLNGQPYEVVGVLPAGVLAAARGDADARRRRARGGHPAAAARRRRRARPQRRGLQHHRQAEARRADRDRRRPRWTRSRRACGREHPDVYPPTAA